MIKRQLLKLLAESLLLEMDGLLLVFWATTFLNSRTSGDIPMIICSFILLFLTCISFGIVQHFFSKVCNLLVELISFKRVFPEDFKKLEKIVIRARENPSSKNIHDLLTLFDSISISSSINPWNLL